MNPDAIILDELLKEMDALMDDAIPGLALLVFEGIVPERAPFIEQRSSAVLPEK